MCSARKTRPILSIPRLPGIEFLMCSARKVFFLPTFMDIMDVYKRNSREKNNQPLVTDETCSSKLFCQIIWITPRLTAFKWSIFYS